MLVWSNHQGSLCPFPGVLLTCFRDPDFMFLFIYLFLSPYIKSMMVQRSIFPAFSAGMGSVPTQWSCISIPGSTTDKPRNGRFLLSTDARLQDVHPRLKPNTSGAHRMQRGVVKVSLWVRVTVNDETQIQGWNVQLPQKWTQIKGRRVHCCVSAQVYRSASRRRLRQCVFLFLWDVTAEWNRADS